MNIADFTLWIMLGKCSGFVPGYTPLTLELCIAQYAAEQRNIVPHETSDRGPTLEEVSEVCWPKTAEACR